MLSSFLFPRKNLRFLKLTEKETVNKNEIRNIKSAFTTWDGTSASDVSESKKNSHIKSHYENTQVLILN